MGPFVWFWTFWHWSTENVRAGALLRSPIHGVGGHWDEWYRHEASAEERRAIAQVGRSARGQRAFVAWLARHWAAEAVWRGEHPPARFVLAQLAALAPFDEWATLARWRAHYGVSGVSAVVLAEASAGDAADVRSVEALAIPVDPDPVAPNMVAETFQVDDAQLGAARAGVQSLLQGRGLVRLLALWIAAGRRPYPRWLDRLLGLAWVVVAGTIAYLVLGPDPGRWLVPLAAALVAVWGALALTAVVGAGVTSARAWREGRRAARRLERSQLRLRMDGGLTLIGGSAGLPFALNALLAVHRASPDARPDAWLWRRVFRGLRAAGPSWAATGVLAPDGRVGSVVVAPKVQACLRHPDVRHLLVPRQRDAGNRAARSSAERSAERVVERPADARSVGSRRREGMESTTQSTRFGFASDTPPLRTHHARHLAGAVLAIGGLTSRRQLGVNALALVTSVTMLAASPDLRGILRPPPAPMVAPLSLSPYQLQVGLDTDWPRDFAVVLESDFWANRRATVSAAGNMPRVELRLSRLARQRSHDVDDGILWVERRRRFLTREFLEGERVGRFPLASLIQSAGRPHG
jgi:hypothetical protein